MPQYSLDISQELGKTNEVYLLYPGKIRLFQKNKLHLVKENSDFNFQVYEMQNPLPVTLGLGVSDEQSLMEERDIKEFTDFIANVNPDVFHIHTLMGLPKECLDYLNAKKIKTVYTTHDFYGLCPKTLSKSPLKELRSEKCSYDCMLCMPGPSSKKLFVMQSHLYKQVKNTKLIKRLRGSAKTSIPSPEDQESLLSPERAKNRLKLREYYMAMFSEITKFHFVSSVAEDYFRQYFPNVEGKTISITHAGLKDNRFKTNNRNSNVTKLRLAYIGPYDEKKGFYDLKDVLSGLLSKSDNIEAHFFGDIREDEFFTNKNVVNHGIVPFEELQDDIQKMSVVVLPSKWHETFGFVVLESLLQGTPCLVSSNVGAKDLLPKDWVFEDKKSLYNSILKMLNSPRDLIKYRESVVNLHLNYKIGDHCKDIIDVFYGKAEV
ncbi:glycosyltransferase [Lactobacillus corticis]|uniref:Glycosyltransferase n=1 Tax=Lactobacillus corticis TaxID=2201249 RepID=A0A916QIH0_9LACO|nr:glycosyltransferase [Lactobacillus corticis]GFZ26172.1 hypothetical protein LCB40_00520 [Lactobacillus corticis]